jgi:hypothetical protein
MYLRETSVKEQREPRVVGVQSHDEIGTRRIWMLQIGSLEGKREVCIK